MGMETLIDREFDRTKEELEQIFRGSVRQMRRTAEDSGTQDDYPLPANWKERMDAYDELIVETVAAAAPQPGASPSGTVRPRGEPRRDTAETGHNGGYADTGEPAVGTDTTETRVRGDHDDVVHGRGPESDRIERPGTAGGNRESGRRDWSPPRGPARPAPAGVAAASGWPAAFPPTARPTRPVVGRAVRPRDEFVPEFADEWPPRGES